MVEQNESWFVAFTGVKERKHLTDWFSPLSCQHCFVYFYDPIGEKWIIHDVNRGGTSIVSYNTDQLVTFLSLMRKHDEHFRCYKVQSRPRTRWPLAIGMWCVTAVRHILGIDSLAIRPSALERDLVRQGAVRVD